MSKVYWIKEDYEENLIKIYKELSKKFNSGKIGIKVHFGEDGCTTYINPDLVKILAKRIKEPYLVECNVLYKSKRTNKKDHVKLAKKHGFNFCKIIIADGEKGDEFFEIEVNKKHFKEVKVGKEIKNFKNLIVFSHFTGHIAAGFGGALKNLGMGLSARRGKLEMHCKTKIEIDRDKCISCGKCIENCPVDAISYLDGKASIDEKKCIKCAGCIAICPEKAVMIPFASVRGKDIQERIVEYCYGINKICNIIYFTALQNITLGCDCASYEQKPVIKDMGILASLDPIAIDQASIGLVKEKMGKDVFKEYNGIDSSFQLKYGEKLGLGKRKYELVEV